MKLSHGHVIRLAFFAGILNIFVCAASFAIILHNGEQPIDKPADGVTGRWGANSSCVAVSPNHVITTRHQGYGTGAMVQIGGINYTAAQIVVIGSVDLRVVRITKPNGEQANLGDHVGLYADSNEADQDIVIGGYGRGPGIGLETSWNDLYGYKWNYTGNSTLRWCTNIVEGSTTKDSGTYFSEVLLADFDDLPIYLNPSEKSTEFEGSIAEYDSGGGWFIKSGGLWKVAALNRGITPAHGSPWPAEGESWFRAATYFNQPAPDGFDGVRISSYREQIENLIAAPNTPTDLVAQTPQYCGQVRLSWDRVAGASGYRIYYSQDLPGPAFEPVVNGNPASASDVGNVNEVTVTDLSPGSTYYFAVAAYAGIAESGYSGQAEAKVLAFDDFNDNRRGSMWELIEGGPFLWLAEQNEHLEALSPDLRGYTESAYASNGWTLNAGDDFSLKIDYHHEAIPIGDCKLFIRLLPDLDSRRYVSFEAGGDFDGPYFSFQSVSDGNITADANIFRDSNDGTLYVSYDTAFDELYLSVTGYGSGNAWQTMAGLLQGEWSAESVYVHIGAGSLIAEVRGGQMYLDDFAVNSGNLFDWPLRYDITGDDFLDWLDIKVIREEWLFTGEGLEADINGDESVNFQDFSTFTTVW